MSNPDLDFPNYQSASGISRRKTGCWTCRIRRKRCDEIQDEQGMDSGGLVVTPTKSS